jgi:hypothetical protein
LQLVTDNRSPDADSRSAAQASPAGSEHDSGSAAHAGNGAGGHGDRRGAATDGLGEITANFVEEALASVSRLLDIYGERARLAVRRSIVRMALGAMVAVCALIWLGAATLTTLRGLCGGVADLSGRPWVGDLVGGALALLLVAGAVALATHIAERRELKRLEAKHGPNASELGGGSDDATAEDG